MASATPSGSCAGQGGPAFVSGSWLCSLLHAAMKRRVPGWLFDTMGKVVGVWGGKGVHQAWAHTDYLWLTPAGGDMRLVTGWKLYVEVAAVTGDRSSALA